MDHCTCTDGYMLKAQATRLQLVHKHVMIHLSNIVKCHFNRTSHMAESETGRRVHTACNFQSPNARHCHG